MPERLLELLGRRARADRCRSPGLVRAMRELGRGAAAEDHDGDVRPQPSRGAEDMERLGGSGSARVEQQAGVVCCQRGTKRLGWQVHPIHTRDALEGLQESREGLEGECVGIQQGDGPLGIRWFAGHRRLPPIASERQGPG